jgi:hypothetical protein
MRKERVWTLTLPRTSKMQHIDFVALFRPIHYESEGRMFESFGARQFVFILQRDMRARTETPTLPRSCA